VDLPQDIPAGTVELVLFFPTSEENGSKASVFLPVLDPDEALQEAARKAADPNRKPVSRHFGCLKNSKAFSGDPVEIQRAMRAEWD
jgi:hypothetical protein